DDLVTGVQTCALPISDCSPPAFREHPMRPEVTVAELIFEGDLLLPVSDQDEITDSLRQRTYWGEADAAASEVEERVRQAWQNHRSEERRVGKEVRAGG